MSTTSERALDRIAVFGLLVVSVPRVLPPWLRLVGIAAAVLFVVVSGRIFAGEALPPTASPLPFFAYPFLVATLLGWAWTVAREEAR